MTQLQIEAGKFYVTRGGEHMGPVEHNGDLRYPFVFGGLTWTADGVWCIGDVDDLDLVAEWVEPDAVQPAPPAPEATPPIPLPAGLTKREWFAGQALRAAAPPILTGDPRSVAEAASRDGFTGTFDEYAAFRARQLADALIAELAKEATR